MICVRNKKKIAIIFLTSIIILFYVWSNAYNKLKVFERRKKFFDNSYIDDPSDEDIKVHQMVYKKLKKNAENKEKIQNMKKIIKQINVNQHVNNNNRFHSFKYENSVLVIQVHNNIRYLAVLLDSVRRVIGITRSLMIFCHDVYDDKINNVIRNITFAKVMQIFYPYSIQLHPNIYPGGDYTIWYDSNAKKKRNAVLAQKKLFWWWTLNQVFDHLEIVKSYNGYVIFLEAEQYVANDIIYMAKMIEHLMPVFCPECVILALGTHRPRFNNYRLRNARLIVGTWGWSNYTNSGFGLNRTIWKSIKKLSEHFCHFNDYGWDNSLRYLASKTTKKQFFMLSTEGPRVFPTTGCSLHENGPNCTLDQNYFDVAQLVWKVKNALFPHKFDVKHDDIIERDVDTGRGEWGDSRDRDLCMFFASNGRREYY